MRCWPAKETPLASTRKPHRGFLVLVSQLSTQKAERGISDQGCSLYHTYATENRYINNSFDFKWHKRYEVNKRFGFTSKHCCACQLDEWASLQYHFGSICFLGMALASRPFNICLHDQCSFPPCCSRALLMYFPQEMQCLSYQNSNLMNESSSRAINRKGSSLSQCTYKLLHTHFLLSAINSETWSRKTFLHFGRMNSRTI